MSILNTFIKLRFFTTIDKNLYSIDNEKRGKDPVRVGSVQFDHKLYIYLFLPHRRLPKWTKEHPFNVEATENLHYR